MNVAWNPNPIAREREFCSATSLINWWEPKHPSRTPHHSSFGPLPRPKTGVQKTPSSTMGSLEPRLRTFVVNQNCSGLGSKRPRHYQNPKKQKNYSKNY